MLKATVRATCVLLLPFETHTSNSVINSNNEYKQRIEKSSFFWFVNNLLRVARLFIHCLVNSFAFKKKHGNLIR